MSDQRYAGYTLRTECPKCGMPLPLDRPTRKATCGQCHADVAIPEEVWHHTLALFESADRPTPGSVLTQSESIAGFNIHMQLASTPPCCEHCGTRYAIDELATNAAQDFACTKCGDPASLWPAPTWLTLHVPTLRQIISTDPGGATTQEGAPLDAALTEEPAPVAMPCPECAGSLRITAKHERVVNCQFCSTDVFLPDEVWRRLHPVKTVQWWFARFEGRTAEQKSQDRYAAQAAEAQAKKKVRAEVAFGKLKWAWLALAPFVIWQIVAIVMLLRGNIGSAAVPYLVVSGVLYTVVVIVGARIIAIADNGSAAKSAFWYWIGGIVGMSPPVAGLIFGLLATLLVVKKREPNPEEPALGVGRPVGYAYLTHCALMQTLFIASIIHG